MAGSLARGQQAASFPAACRKSAASWTACRYVSVVASPDTKLDVTEYSSWTRTKPFVTPAMYDLNKGVREPKGDPWWANLKAQDGWVEPIIDNVLDGHPQAPGEAAGPANEFTVIYHRQIHTTTGITIDNLARTMKIKTTPDGQLVSQAN